MKRIATHEAGHVVVAKALGYSCEYMRIDNNTGDAASNIIWGEDEIFINSFLFPEIYGRVFNGLPADRRGVTFQIAGRFIMILCSGSTAEAYYTHKEDVDNGTIQELPIEMGAGDPLLRTDVDKIEKTESFLRNLRLGIPLDTRENQLFTMFVIVKSDEIYDAIDTLSNLLINSEDLTINQADIDDCLNNFHLEIGG